MAGAFLEVVVRESDKNLSFELGPVPVRSPLSTSSKLPGKPVETLNSLGKGLGLAHCGGDKAWFWNTGQGDWDHTHTSVPFNQSLGCPLSSLGSFTYMFFGANAGWAIWYPSFTSL